MTSNVPWSVKGIDRDARETAKAAAQREGMTLGEWLNQMIYSAGDPNAGPTPPADLGGLKATDIANAFEHLTRRVAGAEARSAESVESLARSLGGVVERLQRMERARNPGEAPPDLLQRVETLEAKAGDRTRIDALRALEKAVAQVAQQFAAAQANSLTRLDAVERSMQSIARRRDTPAATGVSADTMREAFEQMAGRIERAERLAQEAARLKAEAGDSADADFVQKTGLRLRILGDEIKRGGDQIKTLEGSISRLAQQIDAAERRSAEGIQKVADTIADLRADVASGDSADQAAARADIEAAVSEITQRTEDRISALQHSFDEMVRRLDGASRQSAPAPKQVTPQAAPTAAPPRAAAFAAAAPQLSSSSAVEDEFDSVFADLEEAASPAAAAPEASDDLDFNLDDAPAPEKSGYDTDTNDVLAEIREAFGIEPPTPRPAVETYDEEPAEAAAENDEEPEAGDPPLIAEEAPPAIEPSATSNADYLKAARLAAREAAARAAAAETDVKRKLSPKQRAILAARAKRRRLEEEARGREGGAAAAAPLIAEQSAKPAPQADSSSPLKGRIGAAIAKLKSVRAASGAKQDPTLDEPAAQSKSAGASSPVAGAAEAIKKFRALPMSRAVVGVGIGIVLLGVALFVLTKDLLAPKARPAAQAAPADAAPAAATAPVTVAPPAVRDATATAPADDLVRPRDLYLQHITALKSAETDAEAKAALVEIEKAAALGHPPAQLQLGELYKIGQIYEKDLASARQWFERAANGGNVLAMHRLGVMSARGEGGPVDPAASIAWFEKAASFGLLDSQYNLGATYHPTADGQAGGVQNAALAYYWYAVAAKNGDAQAAEMAAGLSATLSPAERAAKDAEVAAWTAQNADPIANELQPGV